MTGAYGTADNPVPLASGSPVIGFLRIAVVTSNLEPTLERWSERYGVGPWSIFRRGAGNDRGHAHESASVANAVLVAEATWGGLTIEVIQPLTSGTHYQRSLNAHEGREHIHHVGVRVDDIDLALEEFARRGITSIRGEASEGSRPEFLDTAEDLGFLLKIVDSENAEALELLEVYPGPGATAGGPRDQPITKLLQLCVVTSDLKRTLAVWTYRYGVGPWDIFRADGATVQERMLGEEPAEFSMFTAAVDWGNINIEIVQPLEGDTLYQRSLDRHGGADHVHHIGVAVDDFDGAIQEFARRGVRRAMSGRFGDARFQYLDTIDDLGFWVELVDMPEVGTYPAPMETYPQTA